MDAGDVPYTLGWSVLSRLGWCWSMDVVHIAGKWHISGKALTWRSGLMLAMLDFSRYQPWFACTVFITRVNMSLCRHSE